MVVVDIDFIHGDSLVKNTKQGYSASVAPLFKPNLSEKINSISLRESMGSLFYLERGPEHQQRRDAYTGEVSAPLTESEIRVLARHFYAGDGDIKNAFVITENPPVEVSWIPLPVWRVNFEDQLATSFYLDPISGKLISRRHDYWRLFDIFWMLHIMDYEYRSDAQNLLLTVATGVGLLAASTGLWLLFYRLAHTLLTKKCSLPARNIESISRFLHKWVSVVVGLQFLIWLGSGLGMNMIDFDAAAGRLTKIQQAASGPASAIPTIGFDTLLQHYAGTPVREISLLRWQEKLVYRVQTLDRRVLHESSDGDIISIDADLARQIAQSSYAGKGSITHQEKVTGFAVETRHHDDDSWAFYFDDGAATTVYVSVEDGRVLEHRNNSWRWFDFFWMLHIMDFDRHEDINNSLVIGFATGSLWLALTGLILVFTSLRRSSLIGV